MPKSKHARWRKQRNGSHYDAESSFSWMGPVAGSRGPGNSVLKTLRREFWYEDSKLDEAVWSRGLPDDVYSTILAHLPLSSFYRLRSVCKSWSLMAQDRNFLDACARVRCRTPSLLLVDKNCCWTYEPGLNEWKSIPLSFFVPQNSDVMTTVVSSAGGRVLLLHRLRLLLHNPLNKTMRLLPPSLDMELTDLPTSYEMCITGMFVNADEDYAASILVMNKTNNVDEEFDDEYDFYEPFVSQIYDSRADSWNMMVDFNPCVKLSIESTAMVDGKLRILTISSSHRPRVSNLAMYSVQSEAWKKENIRMPNEGQRLVAPHLFTYGGALMLIAALPTDETRADAFPVWNNVTIWKRSAEPFPHGPDGHWIRVWEIGSRELNLELWNTSIDSFFFLSGGDIIYFGSRSGSSLCMINMKSRTWRLLPFFPGITSHFRGGGIRSVRLDTFLFEPRFDVVL